MRDAYNLQRFIAAQDFVSPQGPMYSLARLELRRGMKEGHWMWYIFPQFKGLGKSELSKEFAISSRGEAEAYLEHPVLGARLKECTDLVLKIHNRSIKEIFGYPDDLKFRSSMTLFAIISFEKNIFRDAIDRYYEGKLDQLTVEAL
jgi:uncharacterized protein (DUF1810 family)